MVIRHIDIAIMTIRVTETAIIHMGTIDPIGSTAILEARITGNVTTATIGIITTTITKVM